MIARITVRSLFCLGLLSTTVPAAAQGTPPAKGDVHAQPAKTKAEGDAVERARIYYERGLQLFNEENYDAALFEFERAYELAPTFKILYNVGRIQRQQNNYGAALRSYERYLREGAAQVPPERRTEVEREMTVLRPRVAEVSVKVNVDDADVYADDIPVCTATIESTCVGRSPLKAPIIVNGGRHKITASKKGYVTATSLISVVGSDKIDIKLDLVSLDRPATTQASNPYLIPSYIGVGVTGAALIGAGITGYLTSNARDDQEAGVNRLGATRQSLDDLKSDTRTLANVTDGLLIGAAVSAGITTYFVVKALRWKKPSMEVSVGPVWGITKTF